MSALFWIRKSARISQPPAPEGTEQVTVLLYASARFTTIGIILS
ncbi:hypothetical protein [Azospirillum sp. SYSU D00513]|nr:hypothetical protein [Azospirillum sp. SYSU D00513]